MSEPRKHLTARPALVRVHASTREGIAGVSLSRNEMQGVLGMRLCFARYCLQRTAIRMTGGSAQPQPTPPERNTM